ncbi:hypothetical protein AK812_SmicGene11456 [Symbiodinium microadriaticum]|uniref:Uncharacterized protein n=1 Tax=Symbiodinium microadriaticum TaxID=2951 RepID=A0A1Q9ED79_SYMMI|nr:hypothetical protein AK812_SmicGene11456 [Symbiodinium microadriaticum]
MGKRKAAQDTGEDLRTVLREETTNLPLQQQERVLRRMGGQGFQHSLKGRYGLPDEMIQRIHLQGSKDGSTMSFPILALDKWIQDACQRCPDWANLLTTAAFESYDQGGLQAVLYTDEAVPGNVIRADNARRSYLWYISWSNLGKALRSECSWAIVFVLRPASYEGFDLAELSQLADLPWRSHTGGTSAAELVSDRLLQPGVDFKGDAKQTLLCLPLLNYCGQVLLAGKLRDEVECLNRLNRVCRQILTLKSNTKCITQAHVDTLLRLQEQHLQAFKACYGTSQVKPKHHYGFHTSQPAIRLQVFVDCFVCERKNKNFKTQLRGKDCPRQDFETTALASLLSKDRQWTVNWSSRAVLSGPKVQHQGETLRAHAQCQGENFPSGLYILSERLAVHVLGFLMRADGPLAVAARMCCSSWRIDCSTWTKQSQECLVSLTDLSWALRPAWTLEDGMKVILLH